jgi:DNA-binding response OmpR family regulator
MTALLAPLTDPFTRAMSSAPVLAPLAPSVLIADDDDDVRDVIEFRLQVAGYRTMTADNGQTALHRPRVIILDVTMPQLDGLTVCNRLHANPVTAEIPVLMVSGNCAEQDLARGFAAGADDYLPKPFSTHEMMRRVNWLLLSAGH